MSAEPSTEPEVRVSLTLAAAADRCLDADGARERLRADVADEVGTLMRRLGLPGEPSVTLETPVADGSSRSLPRPFVLLVNGQRCRLPSEDFQRAVGFVLGRSPQPRLHGLTMLEAPAVHYGVRDWSAVADSPDQLVRVLRLGCKQAIRRRPASLLTPDVMTAYRTRLTSARGWRRFFGGLPDDVDWLRGVIAHVLRMHISVADHAAVAEAVARAGVRDPMDVAEELISSLRARVVEFQASRAYLRELTDGAETEMRAGVPALRELLNDDLGLTFPDVRLVPTEELPPPAMRIKINDLEGLPWIGFAADRCMVNADPADISARLKSNDVEQTINPATGTPASIAALSERPALDAMGYVTWSQAEHALLCLSASLRGHAGCFVDRQWVERATSTLGQLFPEVVAATDGAASPAQVTTLVRSLLDEGISVADLPLILEVLLEYREGHDPTIPADAFIRARLRRAVIRRWSVSRSHESLLAYLLASDVAAALTGDDGNGGISEQDRDALLDALQEEADFLPSGFGVPVLVTSPPARRALRNIVATEFPRMGVLSHTELPATTALHILGQIPERSPS